MKGLFTRIITTVLLVAGVVSAQAQSMANYTFTPGTNGSLEDLSTGATSLLTGTNDDVATAVTPIGFNMTFMGGVYTSFSANSNGQLQLHTASSATAIGSSGITSYSSTYATSPVLAPMGGDNEVAAGIRYKVIGTAPNRKLVVEWRQFYVYYTDLTNAGNMQLWLEEGTNQVTFIYGEIYNSSSTANSNSIFLSAGNTAGASAFVTVGSTPTRNAAATSPTTNSFAAGSGTSTGSPLIANLGSSSTASRVFYRFTPTAAAPADPTSLTFSTVSTTTTTVNWVDNSTTETSFAVIRATDAAFTQNVVVSNVKSTTAAGTGTAYTSAQTGLTYSTTYYYKVQSLTEGAASTGLTSSQATPAPLVYYWVGATGGTWSTAANWNTDPAGTGTARSTVSTTDVLVVDGAGTTAGAATSILVDASYSIGQLRVTSNTACTLQASTTTTRTLTLTGGLGDELGVETGSSLLLNNASNAVALAFSGTGNTGTIAGTLTLGGSTSNTVTTTGGTGTAVTVTGTVNLTQASATVTLVGSVATLSFANGSNCNVSGATTTAAPVPLATWGSSSTLTVSGQTSSTTTPTNSAQSFGNVVFNCPGLTGTLSFFGTSTASVQGNLTVTSAGTGTFRITSSGTVTIAGNLVVSAGTVNAVTTGTTTVNGNILLNGGTLNPATSTGSLVVLGNTTIASGATLSHNSGTYSQRGPTFTNNGTIAGSTSGGALNFFSPANVAQTFDGSGTITPALNSLGIQNTGNVTLSHTNPVATLRVNLFTGTLINSGKVSLGNGGTNAATVQTGAASFTGTGGNFDVAPAFNLGSGTYNLIYQQESGARTTGVEIPGTRAVGTITLGNTNGLVVAGGPLATGTLTLNASAGNITTTSANLLTITGTTPASITRTTPTGYINGPMAITLPASLATGTTYTLPVGKGSYNPFALVNPTTGSGGTVTVQAEVFDANSGGSAGTLFSSLNSNRYWAASITAGSANFTSSLIQLNDAPAGADAIAVSSAPAGTYTLVGGSAITATATSLTSTAPAATAIGDYYVMATKAAPTLSNLAISPTGNQCSNVVRTVTVDVAAGGSPIAAVTLNYSVNGTAQAPVSMANTSGTMWSGTIPTVSPVNAVVAWSVTATDGNNLSRSLTGTAYQDAPATGLTATATATPASVCAGQSAQLILQLAGQTGAVAVSPSLTTASISDYSNPMYSNWANNRSQFLYRASELTSSGLLSGNMTQLAFNLTSTNTTARNGLTIRMGHTSATALSTTNGFLAPSFTTVYSGTYTPATGTNTFAFTTPFSWDGTSNIVIEFCWDNTASTATISSAATGQTTSFVSALSYNRTSTTGTSICGASNTPSNSYSTRPTLTITGSAVTTPANATWSDGVATVGTTNPLTVTVNATTTYTGTATVGGCPVTSNSVTATLLPLPAAPVATNSTQCGTQTPTASVATASGSAGNGTFKWYTVATGGTALAGQSGTTLSAYPVSTTTTFYVSEMSASNCEGPRAAVTATVTTAPALAVSPATQVVCNNGIASLAPNAAAGAYDAFTWTPTANLYTDAAATTAYTGGSASMVYLKSGTAGAVTYTLNASNTQTGCVASVTGAATVLPVVAATVSPSTICNSGTPTATLVSGASFTGATIAWSASTDNITYTSTGGTGTMYTPGSAITTTTYYRVTVTDGNGVACPAATATATVATPALTGTTPGSRCGTGTVTLAATGSPGTTMRWYAAATGGVALATGASFTTPAISTTTTYYVAAANQNTLSGLGNSGTPTPSNSTLSAERGIVVAVAQSGTLNTAQFYAATGAYSGTARITDNTGTTLVSTPISGTAAAAGLQTMTLNWPMAAGQTYRLLFTLSTGSYSNSNTGVNYANAAWNNFGTAGTITSGYESSAVSSSTYSNFYNMQYTAVCETPRSAVAATVTPAPAIAITNSTPVICSGGSSTLTASSSANPTGYTYTWTPGNLTGATQTVSPSTTTVYTVTGTDASGGTYNGCVASATETVAIGTAPPAIAVTPTSSSITCGAAAVTLAVTGNTAALTPLTELFNSASTQFATATSSGTPSAALNTTYYSEGTGSVLFSTASTSANLSYGLTTNLDLANYTAATLTFSHICAVEYSSSTAYDFGYVQYSTDGGTTWINFPTSSYAGTGTLYNNVVSFNTASYPAWVSQFTTTASTPGTGPATSLWKDETINIPASALTSSQFRIRFRMTTDGTDNYYGWLIDNVKISGTYAAPITWTPTSGLYTDAATTTPYTGTALATVYAKPGTSVSYVATASRGLCKTTVTSDFTVTPTPNAPLANATGASNANSYIQSGSVTVQNSDCELVATIAQSGGNQVAGTVATGVYLNASVPTGVSGRPYLQRSYQITPATNASTATGTVTLYATNAEFQAYNVVAGSSYPALPDASVSTTANTGNVRVSKFSGSSTTGALGSYTPGVQTFITPSSVVWNAAGNGGAGQWEITFATTGFSGFFIHTGSTPLPVSFVDVAARAEGRRNRVEWTTGSEVNVLQYDVEKEHNGSFVTIGTLPAQGRASTYAFYDEKPVTGRNVYRIKATDADGSTGYSKTVSVVVKDASGFALEAFPNPTTDKVVVRGTGTATATASVVVTDLVGRTLLALEGDAAGMTVNLASLPAGTYLLQWNDGIHRESVRVTKQ